MAMEEGDEPEIQTHNENNVLYEAKLREILRNLCSIEATLFVAAAKEFVRLLKSVSGGEWLRRYVEASNRCSEIDEVWKLRQGKPGMAHLLHLVSAILGHPIGMSRSEVIHKSLDRFAGSIIETKLGDINTELDSKEPKRQRYALLALAAVVRRSSYLASEVAKVFDFKKVTKARMKGSVRRAFVEFAMSFLESGNPGLRGWVLQQKEVNECVLHKLAKDDDETVVLVLSTLRDRVLCEESLVRAPLRSVLFGSRTLEQLIELSGREASVASKISHKVLLMVCTDPRNGLMPGLGLKGNEGRLLDLMKKLKAAEIKRHRKLLLAIVKGRPSLGSDYMDEFPYHLEPRSSPLWFSAISLAADLVMSMRVHPSFAKDPSRSEDPPALDDPEVQCILKRIIPCALNRSMMNKGLLHSDILVKHSSLRLLLESLKSVDLLFSSLDDVIMNMSLKQETETSNQRTDVLGIFPGSESFINVEKFLNSNVANVIGDDKMKLVRQKWVSLKQDIQDEIRAVLPDHQTLLNLLSATKRKKSLSSSNDSHSENSTSCLKRCRNSTDVECRNSAKKLKTSPSVEDVDVIVGGINSELSIDATEGCDGTEDAGYRGDLDGQQNDLVEVSKIWGIHDLGTTANEFEDARIFFLSKLLDVLTIYMRAVPVAFDESFDFFKLLSDNPSSLCSGQLRSLLSLLVEYSGKSHGSKGYSTVSESMYKHLKSLIDIIIYSPVKDIQDQAYILAKSAMLSTGAFDQNLSEIDAWLLFLPGYSRGKCTSDIQGTNVFSNLSGDVVKFLCDAVSTTGNNLYKHFDQMRKAISRLEDIGDASPGFGPLIICILEKCLRVLDSSSGTSKKSVISAYVCNTLSYLMQNQVANGLLADLINLILTEKFGDDTEGSFCEWSMKSLLLFARSMSHLSTSMFCSIPEMPSVHNGCFVQILGSVDKLLGNGNADEHMGIGVALSSAILCANHGDLLEHFPSLIAISRRLFGSHFPFLFNTLFLGQKFFQEVANLWPDMFLSGMRMAVESISTGCPGVDVQIQSFAEDNVYTNGNLESDSAAAFALLLKNVPFYILFPAIMNIGNSNLLHSKNMLDLLEAKLLEGSIDDSISSLQLVLFWVYQIRLSYEVKPSYELEQLSRMCSVLIDRILATVLVGTSDLDSSETAGGSVITYEQKIAELVFHHPIVSLSLSQPLPHVWKQAHESIGDNLDDIHTWLREIFHPMDHHILHLLEKAADSFLSVRSDEDSSSTLHRVIAKQVIAFRDLIQKIVSVFMDKFTSCIAGKDLSPILQSFYIISALMRFISPFDLLEIAHWIFRTFDQDDLAGCTTSKFSAFFVGLFIAEGAIDMLSSLLHQINMRTPYSLFWVADKCSGISLLDNVYYNIIDLSIRFRLECADLCLMKAVNAVYSLKFTQPPQAQLPLSMAMVRMIINSPIKLLTYCIHQPSRTKAKILFQLTELSPLHLSLFGKIFLCMLDKKSCDLDNISLEGIQPLQGEMFSEKSNHVLSDEEFVLLLPIAMSYMKSYSHKFGNHFHGCLKHITFFYGNVLFSGFSNWRSFVFLDIFQEDYGKVLPTSFEELLRLCSSSMLGKAVDMLKYYHILNGRSKMKKMLKIFDLIYTTEENDELLDCELNEINISSVKHFMNLINRVLAKITFTRLLLFPQESSQFLSVETDTNSTVTPIEKESKKEGLAKRRFLNILVNALDKLVRKFPLCCDKSNQITAAGCYPLFRLLEVFMLRNIVQLCMEIQSDLIKLQHVLFLEQFIRSSLLYRFEDPVTLRAIRNILVILSEGKISSAQVLELLLGHSQFKRTILWNDVIPDSCGVTFTGTLLQNMPNILESIDILPKYPDGTNGNGMHNASSEPLGCDSYKRKMELIKLLRVLYYLGAQQRHMYPGNVDKNNRELLSLLLAGYGATLCETDLEMFHLMQEIESFEESDCRNITEMDYLWGASALNIRKEQTLDRLVSCNSTVDGETVDERRKRFFGENIPVDPKLCAATVLHFCYDTDASTVPMSVENLQQESLIDVYQSSSSNVNRVRQYDPAFLLRFSVHSLMMGYMEPVEFVRLGLLAVAFVSMSSSDEEMRKLGDKTLNIFKTTLENQKNRKDVLLLRLLLTSLQNGIPKPFQRIPSLLAVFAAEASFILVKTSHPQYRSISEFLVRSRVDLKDIPLFDTLFSKSSSKTDRLWILRLLCAGLNVDDDAQIFVEKSTLESLLSFYTSFDIESKFLVLKIVRKSVKFPKLAVPLVEQCGLLSWLSSIITSCGESLHGNQKCLSLTQMSIALQVVNDVISMMVTSDWLQQWSVEQLFELSSQLYVLTVGTYNVLKEDVALVNSILEVLAFTLKFSQKRDIDRPHFTISIDGLSRLYEAINYMRPSIIAELSVKTMLMSAPSPVSCHKDKAILLKLVMRAISVASQSCSSENFLQREFDLDLGNRVEDQQSEDSMISKLLRWTTSSIILGCTSRRFGRSKSSHSLDRSNEETLQSFLGFSTNEDERHKDCSANEALAISMLYLQQLLGIHCRELPSVVSAICLLFFSDSSGLAEGNPLCDNFGRVAESLCSKIRRPAEANPAWRWSFDSPWMDPSIALTNIQKLEEEQACQKLLNKFSTVLGSKSAGSPVISIQDVDDSGMCSWERNIILGDQMTGAPPELDQLG
ncbi:hypothetical protein QJS10_CPA01g00908 [Acorus calamus]|uniref:Uncharacterized protein n=1 Tax=Acorus calamus TaxID=4465 RepID=A0AAV9FHI3_ACOCL|nr:hypothetical protein QJS10_CPA01g00908 [Acorus calamus]